jgi:hypothetical protein
VEVASCGYGHVSTPTHRAVEWSPPPGASGDRSDPGLGKGKPSNQSRSSRSAARASSECERVATGRVRRCAALSSVDQPGESRIQRTDRGPVLD